MVKNEDIRGHLACNLHAEPLVTRVSCSRYLGLVGVTPQLQQHQPQAPPGSSEPQEDPQVAAARAVCSSLPGLSEQQIEVCLQHPNAIRSVSDGARRGIQECQYQFRNERWNCTTRNEEQSVFGYILERGKFHNR